MVDPGAERGDQLQVRARLGQHRLVDRVRDRGDEDLGPGRRLGQLGGAEWPVFQVKTGVEELHHPRFDRVWQLARDDDQRTPRRHEGTPEPESRGKA
jgi:hypothetical protein